MFMLMPVCLQARADELGDTVKECDMA